MKTLTIHTNTASVSVRKYFNMRFSNDYEDHFLLSIDLTYFDL